MRKIGEILAEKGARGEKVFSFEVFPPRSDKGTAELYRAVEELLPLRPDYVSVTYGAGGSSSKATLAICVELQRRFGLVCMHHLTLVNQTREELVEIIKRIRGAGVRNVLAMRGDPPPEMGRFRKIPGGLEYAYELIDLVRETAGDYFGVAVAGFPEKHPDCPGLELDGQHLRFKLERGADFAVTQLFFDPALYTRYLERTAAAGVRAPIMPGVLPITDYRKLLKFCAACGASVPAEIHAAFAPIQDDAAAMFERGSRLLLEQSRELLRRGAPGIHFYSLNRVEPVATAWRALRGE